MALESSRGPVAVIELSNAALQGPVGPTGATGPQAPPAFVLESPGSGEDADWFYAFSPITIGQLMARVSGSASPSLTWTLRWDSDRTATGTEAKIGGTATTNTTTGQLLTGFDNALIPAGSWVWVETTAASGTLTQFSLCMKPT